jgi:hypothetical protein
VGEEEAAAVQFVMLLDGFLVAEFSVLAAVVDCQ